MKRIVILANSDIGLYKFRKELIQQLIDQGNRVYIALPDGGFIKQMKLMGCKFINTYVDRRGLSLRRDLRLLWFYHNILTEIKPDLVITYTIKPNLYGGIICRCKKIPYAVNITGLGTAFQKNGLLKQFIIMLYKIALKKAKVVFFENSENRQVFLDTKIVMEKHTCLLDGAGVNLEHYRVTKYPSGDITKFLFMGRIMKEKGVDELFDAMKKLIREGYQCSLDVLGVYEEDYEKTIKLYEKEGWLKYYGYQEDVRPFIEASHCFVLPSWHEGMANTNLECAASGRPVITSNIHGCMEAVENEVSGFLVERKNPELLSEIMKRFILMTYEDKKNMGLQGRERMENKFDKRKVVNKTTQMIT